MIKPNDDAVRVALDNIEIQMNAMRSLKGWRLNLIRKYLSDAKAAIASTPSQAVQAEAGRPLAAGTREEIARIIDPRAFIIANSKRFEIKERQDAALAKADAIRALASAATRTGE